MAGVDDWRKNDMGSDEQTSAAGSGTEDGTGSTGTAAGISGSMDGSNESSNGNSYKYDWMEGRYTGSHGGSGDDQEDERRNDSSGSYRMEDTAPDSCRVSDEGREKHKKKGSTGKGIVIGMLIVLIPLLVFVGAAACILGSTGRSIAVVSDSGFDMSAVEAKLGLIQSVIESSFLFDYDEEELTENIYTGYVEGLGDPYTCYYTAEEYQAMMESSEGTYYGIGVMISQEVDTGRVYVVRVFSGSPAEEAGMMAGDIIAEVEGKEVTGIDLNEVVAAIKGAEGTTARIKIYREIEQKELILDVERRQVDVDTVYYSMLDDHIGYLELTEFDSVSTDQFISALEDLKSQGMESLILDLRDNPGGILEVAVDLADELIDTGTVVSIRDKNGNEKSYAAEGEGSLGIPLAVLVNGDSASASEVLSGCIRDYGVGTLIGTQTFGKGIVQNIIPFSDGTAMKITTAHYYTPDGTDIHGVGITPDIVVEEDRTTEDVDEQLEAAIELLTKDRQ